VKESISYQNKEANTTYVSWMCWGMDYKASKCCKTKNL